MSTSTQRSFSALLTGYSVAIGIGVSWAVYPVYGFWWAVAYGLCWEIWIGYRVAAWLVAAR